MGDIALPSSDRLKALSGALGASPSDLLQASGYIDSPVQNADLPEIKTYLKRRYGIDNIKVLQALETLVVSFRSDGV